MTGDGINHDHWRDAIGESADTERKRAAQNCAPVRAGSQTVVD